jgi:hypothetical protein
MDSSADLTAELKLVRLCALELAEAGNLTAVPQICAIIGRLAVASTANDVRAGRSLPTLAVQVLVQALVVSINRRLEEFQAVNREAIIDAILLDTQELFALAKAGRLLPPNPGLQAITHEET